MGSRTTTFCDIQGCEKDADHHQKTVSVRFMTEQNEGRSTTPYLTGEKLDFCFEHYKQYIDSLPLQASGAMGYNEYVFKESK